MSDFGDWVRERRHVQRLSQPQLADRCGMHFSYISKIENGARPPNRTTLNALIIGLDLTAREAAFLTDFAALPPIRPRSAARPRLSRTLDERIDDKIHEEPNGCLIWTGAITAGGPVAVDHGKQLMVRRVLFRQQFGWIPSNLGICAVGGIRCVAPEHAHPGRRALPKFAIAPGERRLRELGPLAIPAPGPAISDVRPCPECGAPMTGFRALEDGFKLLEMVPTCLMCTGSRVKYGGYGSGLGKYALTPSPRRKAYLADKQAIMLAVSRVYVLPIPEPRLDLPIDLWLFDDRPVRGGVLRQRLAERNLGWRRRDVLEVLGS